MKTKRILAGLLSAAAVCGSLAAPVYAKDEIRVIVNNAKLDFDDGDAQVIGTGTTMVPFRYILEALGMDVSYRKTDNYFRIWAINEKEDIRFDMFVGEKKLYVSKNSVYNSVPGDEDKLLDPAIAAVIELEEAPFIDEGGSTLVPVRALSEALGAKVDWIQSTKTVTVHYDKVPYYGDNSKGKYPDTDIATYYDATGTESISVTIDPESVKYEYPYTRQNVKNYVDKLVGDGMTVILQGEDVYILESVLNKYLAIQMVTDETMIVSVMSNPEVYVIPTEEEVPNYTYCTGRECMKMEVDEDGTHFYIYSKDEKEMKTYFDVLEAAGYKKVNEYTGETGSTNCLFAKGVTNVSIIISENYVGLYMLDSTL